MSMLETKTLPKELKKQAADVFADPTTMATPALVLSIQLFDEDCLAWDSVFLEEAIRRHLEVTIHDDVMQRLQAAILVLDSKRFFTEPEIFHIVCSSMLDPDTRPEQMAVSPSPVELAWSCTEVKALLGDDYATTHFGPQVRRYCGAALMDNGLYRPPSALSFASFPPDRYPALASTEDTLMAQFEREQRLLIEDIDSSLELLKKLYRQQLASLAVFGGNQALFKSLAN